TTNGGTTWSSVGGAAAFGGANFGIWGSAFVSTETGWVVGGGGNIYKTTNGGTTWTAQTSGVAGTLNGIRAYDANTVFAVGDSGVILRTTNGGTAWASLTSGTSQHLNDVLTTQSAVAYAVGESGTIVKTQSNGNLWTTHTSGTNLAINTIAVAPSPTGMRVLVGDGAGVVYRPDYDIRLRTNTGNTQNGAPTGSNLCATLTPQVGDMVFTCNHANLTGGTWYTISVLTSLKNQTGDAVAAEFSAAFQTVSLSVSSTSIADTATAIAPTATVTADFNTALARRYFGAWTELTTDTSAHLNGVAFPSLTTGYVVGNGGVIRKSTDGGPTWTALTSGTTHDLSDIHCASATTCWVVGSASNSTSIVILKTTDGTSWTSTTPTTGTALSLFDGVHCVDSSTCWAFGMKADAGPSNVSGVVFKTTDGGSTWSLFATQANGLPSGSTALDGYFVNDTVGYAVGGAGAIRKTTDGGATWVSQTSGTAEELKEVHCSDPSTCLAVGDDTTIVRTTNGGSTWTSIATSGVYSYQNVRFAGGGRVYLAGETTRTSDDNGLTWSDQSVGTVQTLLGLAFPESLTGYAVGENGAITKHLGNIRLQANTGNSQHGSPAGSNLCSSLDLGADGSGNSDQRITCGHAELSGNTWYTLTVVGGVYGVQGSNNATISANATRVFQTQGGSVATDTTPPSNPTSLLASPTSTQVTLTWVDPTDQDLSTLRIIRAVGDSPATTLLGTVQKGVRTYVDTSVTPSTAYTYTVESVDQSGNRSSGTSVTATVPATTPSTPSTTTPDTTSTTSGITSTDTTTPATTDHGTPTPGDTTGLLGGTPTTTTPDTTSGITTPSPTLPTPDLLPGIAADEPIPVKKPPTRPIP
ncbi:MAG: YCF48-related protein, partial [bacterium]|nr:YCF48-related protein [bacterium]